MERSCNYKLRATWLTPEVIRATAQLAGIRRGLSDAQAEAMLAEAEAAGGTVVLVEIDPREGSGVIPNDWTATLTGAARNAPARGLPTRSSGDCRHWREARRAITPAMLSGLFSPCGCPVESRCL
jgi:hypothetical protein